MPLAVRTPRRQFLSALLLSSLCVLDSGCSLFVMAGKMLVGDPVIDDEFQKFYGKSMEKSGKSVAVMVATPDAVKSEFSSLDLDLAADISRKLSLHRIKMVENHRVASWIDDHGGGDVDLIEMGNDIDTDLVIRIILDHFDYREENSPDLFRGHATGRIIVYELVRDDESTLKFESKPKSKSKEDKDSKSDKTKSENSRGKIRRVREVYTKSFDSRYPALQPVSISQMQPDTFRKKFLDRLSDELSRLFYSHKPGVEF